MGGSFAPIVGNPSDGPAAGRVGYLSCWGNTFNSGPSRIGGFPDKLDGLIGDGAFSRGDVDLVRQYHLPPSSLLREKENGHYGHGVDGFKKLLNAARDAAVAQGKEMARARVPMPNKGSIGPHACPDGVDVIFVSDDKGAIKRYPDFCNQGVHCNPDGRITSFRVNNWGTFHEH
jgi:hypothetical protein